MTAADERSGRDQRWEGPSPGVLSKFGIRLIRHLTRRIALISLVLAALAGYLAVVVDPASAVGQVLLVLAGILVSVVLLPDSPNRLWNVTAEDLAETVPSTQLLGASRAIAAAIAQQSRGAVSGALAVQMWDDALGGIGRVVADASSVVIDLDYTVRVQTDGLSQPVVSSTASAKRCVPQARDGRVWFSYCSNLAALEGEFAEHSNGCIGRELIDLQHGETLDDWQARVEAYEVDFTVDGVPAPDHDIEVVAGPDWRVVRVPFDGGALPDRFLPTTLNVEFHADLSQCRFPVKFSAYFVVGPTKITFEVLDPKARLGCDEYLASATRAVNLRSISTISSRGYRVLASEGTVLPPGAGVVFSWDNAPSEDPLLASDGETP